MRFMSKLRWEKIKGISVVKVKLPNNLVATVIERPDSYLVNTPHPLTTQKEFPFLSQVDKYLCAVSNLGEYNG